MFYLVQPQAKKIPAQKFCCRFHHSLPDAPGDHIGRSVHRVNCELNIWCSAADVPEEAKPPYRPLPDIRDDIDRACDGSVSRLDCRTGKFARLIPFRMMMERNNYTELADFIIAWIDKNVSAR
jgi:hypothetical protein